MISVYTTYNKLLQMLNIMIIFPYMPRYLLDSFSKADGENSGVNLVWALNGYVISITG